MTSIDDLIELGDPDELLREIDRICDQGNWSTLNALRIKCLGAVERGRQLWGVAGNAAYRLALQADAEYAAGVIDAQSPPFLLGPLPEVMASTHTWDELASYFVGLHVPQIGTVAYERVMRGEDLREYAELDQHVATFELPMVLQEWEPQYSLAEYRSKDATFPSPALKTIATAEWDTVEFTHLNDGTALDAIAALTSIWTTESNGVATIVGVEGGLSQVLSASELTLPGPSNALAITASQISFGDALAAMAWAGASGGAHGRRGGAAVGRAKAWWVLAAVLGVAEDWPLPSDELGELGESLQFWTWGEGTTAANAVANSGWQLRLAIVDVEENVAYGINAQDAAY